MKEYSVLFVRDTPNLNVSFMQNIKKIKEKWIIHSEYKNNFQSESSHIFFY